MRFEKSRQLVYRQISTRIIRTLIFGQKNQILMDHYNMVELELRVVIMDTFD